MKIRVYLNESISGETSLILASKEFGLMEYYDNDDLYRPLTFKNFKDLINTTQGNSLNQKVINFHKWFKITLLGEL